MQDLEAERLSRLQSLVPLLEQLAEAYSRSAQGLRLLAETLEAAEPMDDQRFLAICGIKTLA